MQYDDIIVGAGSSGAALATRLSDDAGRAVPVLEAGPDYLTVESASAVSRNCLPGLVTDWMRGTFRGASS